MPVGVLEVLFVLFVVLLILGPRRIVDLGRALGCGVRDFKLAFAIELPVISVRPLAKTRKPAAIESR